MAHGHHLLHARRTTRRRKQQIEAAIQAEFAQFAIVRETSWAMPDWTILALEGDELAAFYNIVERTVTVDGVPVRVAGLNNLVTLPAYRGRGMASRLLRETQEHWFDSLGAECGLLLCADALLPFYSRLQLAEGGSPRVLFAARRPANLGGQLHVAGSARQGGCCPRDRPLRLAMVIRGRARTNRGSHGRMKGHPRGARMKFNREWFRKEVAPILLALVLVTAARSSLADHYYVPSGSMENTLFAGDRVVVDKTAYGWRIPYTKIDLVDGARPQPGEVAVFDSPADGMLLIKRIVAVGGQVVSLHDGHLVVDGGRARVAGSARKRTVRRPAG